MGRYDGSTGTTKYLVMEKNNVQADSNEGTYPYTLARLDVNKVGGASLMMTRNNYIETSSMGAAEYHVSDKSRFYVLHNTFRDYATASTPDFVLKWYANGSGQCDF